MGPLLQISLEDHLQYARIPSLWTILDVRVSVEFQISLWKWKPSQVFECMHVCECVYVRMCVCLLSHPRLRVWIGELDPTTAYF